MEKKIKNDSLESHMWIPGLNLKLEFGAVKMLISWTCSNRFINTGSRFKNIQYKLHESTCKALLFYHYDIT